MEIAAGVVSLTWDVFESTVRSEYPAPLQQLHSQLCCCPIRGSCKHADCCPLKVFKFITALVEMPREFEKHRLQLIIEYHRVLAWGKAAGLVDPNGRTLPATLGTNSIEFVAIVARIQRLLADFNDLNARYSNQLPTEIINPESLKERDVLADLSSLSLNNSEKKEQKEQKLPRALRAFLEKAGHTAKELVTQPVRVRWVAVDKDAFEVLLKDLHGLTERLYELMRNYREKQLNEITAKTYREMVLARNDIQELRDMFDAVSSIITTSADDKRKGEGACVADKTLQDLVRLKKLGRISESILSQINRYGHFDADGRFREIGITVHKYTASDLASFVWNELESVDAVKLDRPRGLLTTKEGDIYVWIEWKPFPDVAPDSIVERESMLRTAALAEMLHLPKPASLCVPECIGYFDDREVNRVDRFGWIFKMPDGSGAATRLISLYDILGDDSFKPSLSQRVALASKLCSTVLNLHAVDWLHKGILSDNVIFHLHGEKADYDPEKPLLAGFEFSRPDGTETTARDFDHSWDLYRWPNIQRERPTQRNSKKTYDLYSLGLVLLEIAHWQKLHQLMEFPQQYRNKDTLEEPRPAVPLGKSKMVRDWLLGDKGEESAPFVLAGRPNPLKELGNITGDRYRRAVERCLWAHGEKGFGVEEAADQSNDSNVGIMLQEAFTKHVVEELASIQL